MRTITSHGLRFLRWVVVKKDDYKYGMLGELSMRAIGVKKKRQVVTKSNDLISASYDLSVREQRLLLAAISTIYPKGVMPEEIIVTAEFYSSIYGVDNPWRDMSVAVEGIFNRHFEFSNDREFGKHHWVKTIAYANNHGYVRIVFHEALIPHLSQLSKRFSSFDLTRIAKLSSTYSIRLFEMLVQWRVAGQWNVSLADLRERLRVPKSYEVWGRFQERVLAPAIREINEHSGLRVEYTPRYLGRAVSHLDFTVDELYGSILASDQEDSTDKWALEAEKVESNLASGGVEWVVKSREDQQHKEKMKPIAEHYKKGHAMRQQFEEENAAILQKAQKEAARESVEAGAKEVVQVSPQAYLDSMKKAVKGGGGT